MRFGTQNEPFILASSSPRRRQLLHEAGLQFRIIVPDVDETEIKGESGQDMVERLAALKADRVGQEFPASIVVAADTTVVLAGRILGKPTSASEAKSMLAALSGKTHEVLTGVAIVHGARRIRDIFSSRTEVTMAKLSAAEVEAFVRTGEPMDKAGAYAIQGIGSQLVERINGSYTNVVGLDVAMVVSKLIDLGVLSQKTEIPDPV